MHNDKQIKSSPRIQEVLRRAKRETAMKEASTFIFSRFFSTLLILIAPFFQQKPKHKPKG